MSKDGILRHVDSVGRIVLPKEWRRFLNIESGDDLEIFVEDSKIILQKHEHSCAFCRSSVNIREFKGQYICTECTSDLTK